MLVCWSVGGAAGVGEETVSGESPRHWRAMALLWSSRFRSLASSRIACSSRCACRSAFDRADLSALRAMAARRRKVVSLMAAVFRADISAGFILSSKASAAVARRRLRGAASNIGGDMSRARS